MLMAEKLGLSGVAYEIWEGKPPRMAERFVLPTTLIPLLKSYVGWDIGGLIVKAATELYPEFQYIKSESMTSHTTQEELQLRQHDTLTTVRSGLEHYLSRDMSLPPSKET
jgi:hypothetical protein